MSKFTKKFNSACSRFAFWQTLTAKLAEFDRLVKHGEHLRPEDVKAQREIHKALYGCYSISKDMRERRKDDLKRMVSHEHRVTD